MSHSVFRPPSSNFEWACTSGFWVNNPGVQTVGRKTSWAKDVWANYFWATDDWATTVISEKTFRRKTVGRQTVSVLGKNIWGAWPLIIWEATTAKRNYYRPN